LPRRKFDSHKSNYGRVAIVAGSRGFTGAAIMTATAALRAGAGLIMLYVTEDIYAIVAASAPPEIMVHPVASYREVIDAKRDVIAIGPGLGTVHREEVLHLIEACSEPMVVDADALNILSTSVATLKACRGPRLLTPHPGEMSRLFQAHGMSRREIVEAFTGEFSVTLLLKGSRTIIGEKGWPHSFNSTGTPGMATGGMGDILTGVCAALIGQSIRPYHAARLGAWLCGRAAEFATYNGPHSEESLAPSDILENLGVAFKQLRTGCF
jgi:NAD(P)H-hydrate epimerase